MKQVPRDIKTLGYRNRSSIREFLEEFIDGGQKCVEVTEYHHKNAESCSASLYNSAKRYRMLDIIEVSMRKGKVFLIRKCD